MNPRARFPAVVSHRASFPIQVAMNRILVVFLLVAPLFAQSNTGELRLRVTDPAGLGIKSSVELVSEANHYRQAFFTDDAGDLVVKRLPFGMYNLEVRHATFAPASQTIEIRFAAPASQLVKLSLVPLATTVEVKASGTLVDPHRVGTVNQIGADTIADRATSLPGRSLQDLVNSQPGWLYEGNAVL